MDIQAEKMDLITWLSQLNDVSIIKEIKVLKQQHQQDWWDELSQHQKDDIEAGLADLRLGKKKHIASVLEKYK